MRASVLYLRCLSFYIEDDKYTNIISDIDNAVLEYEEVLNVSDKNLIFSKYENLYSILNEHITNLKRYFKNFDIDDFIKNELFIDNQINKEKQSFIEKEIIKAYLYEKYLFDFYGTVSLYTKITKNELVKQGRDYDDLIPMAMLEEGGNDEIGTDRNVVKIYVYSDGTISEKRDSSLSKISFNCLKDTSGFDWSAKGYDVNMSLENRFNFPKGRDEDEEGVESVPVEKTYEDEIIEGIVFDAQNNDFTSILSNFNFDEFELNLDILLDSKKNAYIQDFNFLFFILCAIVMQMRNNEKKDVDDSSLDIIESRVQRIKSDIKSKLAEQGIENIKGFLQSADESPILEKLVSLYPRTKEFFYKTDEEKKTIYLSVLGEVLSADFEILTDEKENELLVESSCKRVEVEISPIVESTIKKTIVLAQRESAKNLEDDILSADNVEKVPYRIENTELNLSRANNIDKDTNDNSANDEELDTKNEEEESSTNVTEINDDKNADEEEDKGNKLEWWEITIIAALGVGIATGIGAFIVYRSKYKCGNNNNSNDEESGRCGCPILDEGAVHTSRFFDETTNRAIGKEVVPLINALLGANNADNDAENNESDLNREMKENLLKSAEKKRAELIIDDETKTELMRFFSFEIINDKKLKIDNLRKNQRIELLKLINTYYNNTHSSYNSSSSVGIDSADAYAKLFLGFNDEEIQIIKDFVEKDESSEYPVYTSSFHDNNNKEYKRIHDVFDNEFIKEINNKGNIRIPEYEGFYSTQSYYSYSTLRTELRSGRVKDQDYDGVICGKNAFLNKLQRTGDNGLLPRFKYPHKITIGFSPIFFDDDYDATEGKNNDAYTLGKVLYLTHFFEKLKEFNTEFRQLDYNSTVHKLELYADEVLPDNPIFLPKLKKQDVAYYFNKLKRFDVNYRRRFHNHQIPAMFKSHLFAIDNLRLENVKWPIGGNINQDFLRVPTSRYVDRSVSNAMVSNMFLKILVFFMHLDFHDIGIPQTAEYLRRSQDNQVDEYYLENNQTISQIEDHEDERLGLYDLIREDNNVYEVQRQYLNAINRYINAPNRNESLDYNIPFYSNEQIFKAFEDVKEYLHKELKPDVYPDTKVVKRGILRSLPRFAPTFVEETEMRRRDRISRWTINLREGEELPQYFNPTEEQLEQLGMARRTVISRDSNGQNSGFETVHFIQEVEPTYNARIGVWPTKQTEEIDEELHDEIIYEKQQKPPKKYKIKQVVRKIVQMEQRKIQYYASNNNSSYSRPNANGLFSYRGINNTNEVYIYRNNNPYDP